MTNEIIRKLNAHIAERLTREPDVTYLLVQLGKLVERERPRTAYPVLRFYRNWVAHEKMDRVNANPALIDILDTFENIVKQIQAGGDASRVVRAVVDSVSLSKLEQDIDRIFDDFPQFDRSLVNRPQNWPSFRPLLLRILADITLEADGSYRFLKDLRIDGANGRLDTLVVTDRSGQSTAIPLMP